VVTSLGPEIGAARVSPVSSHQSVLVRSSEPGVVATPVIPQRQSEDDRAGSACPPGCDSPPRVLPVTRGDHVAERSFVTD